MADQQARLSWRDGSIPVSDQFDDPYFSIHDGLAETEHVFLGGNDLAARFASAAETGADFHIAELGFGTGLNLLAAWRAWETAQEGCAAPSVLHFTSFEAFPMAVEDMARALEAFPEVAPWAERFLAVWEGAGACDLGNLRVNVITGDARVSLPEWTGKADAWFLDGFSPAKNPELWQEDLLGEVARHTATGGSAATYTAAGFVRRGLEAAGFEVSRTPGFGRKRHMTKAQLR
ncbi:tRNA (5-methylaminomethyl-2-thiouridine)(34)-methyltransferase MnmD [Phaeobacter piscinae]|uniref:tRNA (5-methylaminomethyl-2-thiouridine)(34)-methyltransferase MnmD n=1 Tax=Phaeobacter piscinae TaxID=1580596 RepID=UPI000C9BD1B1|nr:tRNA (5-methylaminomethyl-2-thiouridine)(34)-methyltransferase MnmD [Phaeobacter piscinae]AUQ73273.1 tRNA 5-methylaminomethyl-2-thiouridine biosynthesis bifunctional protein MnmC-like protein [Phaeobacter piscinae]